VVVEVVVEVVVVVVTEDVVVVAVDSWVVVDVREVWDGEVVEELVTLLSSIDVFGGDVNNEDANGVVLPVPLIMFSDCDETGTINLEVSVSILSSESSDVPLSVAI
jgi:hypothetical protein